MKTIISKKTNILYEVPGNLFIEIIDDGEGYTEFYMMHYSYSYIPCIARLRTTSIEDLDILVANLFVENFCKYLRFINGDHGRGVIDCFERATGSSIETLEKETRRKIKEKDFDFLRAIDHTVLTCKFNGAASTYTIEAAEKTDANEWAGIYVSNKAFPDFKILVDTFHVSFFDDEITVESIHKGVTDFFDSITRHIDKNYESLKEAYKKELEKYNITKTTIKK